MHFNKHFIYRLDLSCNLLLTFLCCVKGGFLSADSSPQSAPHGGHLQIPGELAGGVIRPGQMPEESPM